MTKIIIISDKRGVILKNKKKIRNGVLIFVVIIFLIIGVLVISSRTMDYTLRREISNIEKLDITKDKYDNKVKTLGGYGEVEKTIKSFYYENSNLLQEVLRIREEEKFVKVLSFDNYSNDGPLFETSLKYLNEKRTICENNLTTLIKNYDSNNITNMLKAKGSFEKKLYTELMLNNSKMTEFENMRKYLDELKADVFNSFDVSINVLSFLVSNKDSWNLENGEIRFQTRELFDKYSTMINSLKK